MIQLVRMAKLSEENKKIATNCIVREEAFADVGAIVHMDRRTVSRRMETVILPELDRMLKRMNQTGLGA